MTNTVTAQSAPISSPKPLYCDASRGYCGRRQVHTGRRPEYCSMLKFFREYNKYILVVGVALLMVAFLVGPTLSMFAPEPGAEMIGSIGDRQVTILDLRQAKSELTLLQDVAPRTGPPGRQRQNRRERPGTAVDADAARRQSDGPGFQRV